MYKLLKAAHLTVQSTTESCWFTLPTTLSNLDRETERREEITQSMFMPVPNLTGWLHYINNVLVAQLMTLSFATLHNTNISVKTEKDIPKGKHHSPVFWKAFQICRIISQNNFNQSNEMEMHFTPIWSGRGCLLEVLNLTPKRDQNGRPEAYADP